MQPTEKNFDPLQIKSTNMSDKDAEGFEGLFQIINLCVKKHF